jgi:hypothetical protein
MATEHGNVMDEGLPQTQNRKDRTEDCAQNNGQRKILKRSRDQTMDKARP